MVACLLAMNLLSIDKHVLPTRTGNERKYRTSSKTEFQTPHLVCPRFGSFVHSVHFMFYLPTFKRTKTAHSLPLIISESSKKVKFFRKYFQNSEVWKVFHDILSRKRTGASRKRKLLVRNKSTPKSAPVWAIAFPCPVVPIFPARVTRGNVGRTMANMGAVFSFYINDTILFLFQQGGKNRECPVMMVVSSRNFASNSKPTLRKNRYLRTRRPCSRQV